MQTRRGIFETNSSSSHSLVSVGKPDYAVIDDREKTVKLSLPYLDDDQYPELEETDWEKNAQMAYAYAKYHGTEGDMAMLKKVIEDYTKKKVEFLGCELEDEDEGEGSRGNLEMYSRMFKDEKTLKDSIFLVHKFIFTDTTSY